MGLFSDVIEQSTDQVHNARFSVVLSFLFNVLWTKNTRAMVCYYGLCVDLTYHYFVCLNSQVILKQ